MSWRPSVQSSGRVASADDHAALTGELRLLAHDVVEAAAEPLVDVVDLRPTRLERTVPGGDDHHAREIGVALVGRGARAGPRRSRSPARASLPLLAQAHVGPVLEALLGAHVDELLAEDLREAGDVVNVLFRVGRSHLAADLLERLDDADRPVAMPDVVGGRRARTGPRRGS